MALPDQIMLLGRPIAIKIVPTHPINKDGESLDGLYDSSTRSITLFDGLNEVDMLETLYHEAGHAYQDFLGWNQNLTDREQELLCQMLTLFVVDMKKVDNL